MRPALLILMLLPSLIQAQWDMGNTEATARYRRETRDKAVTHAGSQARPMVESDYGDEAARALLKCSEETAARLADFHSSGGFSKLAQPKELLETIARQRNADETANWIIDHANELTTNDAVTTWLSEPITFVLALKPLSQATKERIEKENAKNPGTEQTSGSSEFVAVIEKRWRGIVVVSLIIGGTGFIIWWKRRRMDGPA